MEKNAKTVTTTPARTGRSQISLFGSDAQNWFDAQMAKRNAERKADDEKANAEKEKGMAAGAKNHASLLQAAQTVARSLAVDGVVTIDDVVREMRRQGFREDDIKAGDAKAKNWKGSVFSDADWVCVGTIASREASAHGRHVRQWATKGWLRNHPVNGTNSDASCFHLFGIYNEAVHFYPAGTELVFILGRDMLDSSFDLLKIGRTHAKFNADGSADPAGEPVVALFGCKVFVCDGVGAVCLPRRALEGDLREMSLLNRMTP